MANQYGTVKIENTTNPLDQNYKYVEFPAKKITPQFSSLATSDSGRSMDGVLHIAWIKKKLRKWEIEVPPVYNNDNLLKDLIELVQGEEYYITIYDLKENQITTNAVHCYTSTSSADMYSGVVRDGIIIGFKFNAIEMGDQAV